MSDTVTVYHPDIPKVSNEVPKAMLDRWVKSGWLKSEPKISREADPTAAE